MKIDHRTCSWIPVLDKEEKCFVKLKPEVLQAIQKIIDMNKREDKWIIGKEYEFSDTDFNNGNILKGIYAYYNPNKTDGNFNYIVISKLGRPYAFKYIREIQEEVIEPRFIETEIKNENGEYHTFLDKEYVNIGKSISLGAIGFKFEGDDEIYNIPIHYIDDDSSSVWLSSINSKDKFKVLRAKYVVWLNPKYKE